MATYNELHNLFADDALRNRVRVAVIVAAELVRGESPTTPNNANRLKWAKAAFECPGEIAQRVLMAVLAANRAAAVATIQAASDTTVQTAVNAAVDIFADGS